MENKTFTALALGSPSTQTASVYVYDAGTSTLASIYGSNVIGSPLAQPLLTNSIGQVSFWAPNGTYDLKFITPGGQATPLTNVEFFDGSAAFISVANEGTGSGVADLSASVGGALVLKSIAGGTNVTVSASSNTLTVSVPSLLSGIASEGSGNPVYDAVNSTPSSAKIKSLIAGANVTITDSGIALTIAAGAGSNSLATNGYQVFPGGLIVQWGTVLVSAGTLVEGDYPTTFPMVFPNACLCLIPTVVNNSHSNSYDVWAQWNQTDTTPSTGHIYIQWDGQPNNQADGYSWIAIGH